MKDLWKVIAVGACSALLTGFGVQWVMREDMLEALNNRPTNEEMRRAIQVESPYAKDRELVMESLRRHGDAISELTKSLAESTKAQAALAAELRAYIRSRSNK